MDQQAASGADGPTRSTESGGADSPSKSTASGADSPSRSTASGADSPSRSTENHQAWSESDVEPDQEFEVPRMMPYQSVLVAAGRTDLDKAIKRAGGYMDVAHALGWAAFRKPRGEPWLCTSAGQYTAASLREAGLGRAGGRSAGVSRTCS